MTDMVNPYFDDQPYVFFEPRPSDIIDDSTLEGCLRHASRVE
jgi:ubiquitin C-terminal hydrolase